MKRSIIERMYLRTKVATSQILVFLLLGGIIYTWDRERQYMEGIEAETCRTKDFRKEVRDVYVHVAELSLLGEGILEWNDADAKEYHRKRLELDSLLVRFRNTGMEAGHIDSVRHLLAEKEKQLYAIMEAFREQSAINDRIAGQVPIIVRNSIQEQPKKPKRKGFLGLFGKKEEAKTTTTITMLRSLDRNMIAGQQTQSRRLSEHADSLAARNAELNRQLQSMIRRTDDKVQADLQNREAGISAIREQSFIQIGVLTGFILLLLTVSYIIIHRNASRIRQYKQKTTELIGQLEQSVKQNETLIASRKKAVHTIIHELRTPLTAITGYAELLQKDCDTDKTEMYVRNIRQSSDCMREMLDSLLGFFRLDNGKEQPDISPCRISAIAHILEAEFMPAATDKGLTLTISNQTDAIVLTDKVRILQIGNNLLSNAIKFTDNGNVTLMTDYDNGMLKLAVEDTGTGMTEDEQQRVFNACKPVEGLIPVS